jgi:hypothetical protein
MIDNTYRFLNDDEPTEKDLAELMHEVAFEARERADSATLSFRKRIREEVARLRLQYPQTGK